MNIKYNIIILFFVFNTFGLPLGLHWSNIMSPAFLVLLVLSKKIKILLMVSVPFLLFIIFQFTTEPYVGFIDKKDYLFSAGYFFASIVSAIYLYVLLKQIHSLGKTEVLFKKLLQVNSVLVIFAIFLYFTPFQDFVWGLNEHAADTKRLKMFESEPAHYGYLLMPFLLYTLLKVVVLKKYEYSYVMFLILAGSVLCLSMGTIGSIFIASTISLFVFIIPILKRSLTSMLLLGLVLLIIVTFFGESLLNRMDIVLSGGDHSGNVRTIYSTTAAYYAIEHYNYWFGLGFGQVKYYITQFTSLFPGYGTERLPSSLSSTLATVGVVGIFLKYSILFILFFKTKVYTNIFRFTIFNYIFIYGFTGGWMINVSELFLCVVAFAEIFPEFEYKQLMNKHRKTI